MPELPNVSGKELVSALQRAGWTVRRIEGSHYIMWKDGSPPFPIPVHGNKDLRKGTLKNILQQSGLTVEELIRILGK
ncbi:type II toxin-antitoxin system HicA family toxin [Alicyclobacillus vulcanalis]|uniref:Predicted RNA binding protein YcfA, dsRBD-like fold, HicA-like mRNA interferase family n=1 Tax=Alicyclobacillus vulcanalis TaxID=252246 RepID=A0A1N7MPS1_9BACL|nr:type II toxin-antitoxin system HicA family toxin [Alicyclobacillus vulcanalis]SIS88107.1 Predicted RNA binding protein YcfA, dsRBD-like fold, HicA-like mRNA interferase family [Alicyclobacillus vulcanalis]